MREGLRVSALGLVAAATVCAGRVEITSSAFPDCIGSLARGWISQPHPEFGGGCIATGTSDGNVFCINTVGSQANSGSLAPYIEQAFTGPGIGGEYAGYVSAMQSAAFGVEVDGSMIRLYRRPARHTGAVVDNIAIDRVESTPEPATLAVVAAAVLVVMLRRRRVGKCRRRWR